MIAVENVCKRYVVGGEPVTALDNISLSIAENDYVAVTGPSGSGKSTLLYTIGGLLTPDEGNVKVDGNEVYGISSRQRAKFRRDNIGFIFQKFELIPYLSALENVMLPLVLDDADALDQIDWGVESLERVGLGKRLHHKPSELSGGEQQRVAIARGLVNEPNILLADEPTGNLDMKTGDDIMALLSELNDEGQTIVFVTHDQARTRVSNRVIVMLDGRILGEE